MGINKVSKATKLIKMPTKRISTDSTFTFTYKKHIYMQPDAGHKPQLQIAWVLNTPFKKYVLPICLTKDIEQTP